MKTTMPVRKATYIVTMSDRPDTQRGKYGTTNGSDSGSSEEGSDQGDSRNISAGRPAVSDEIARDLNGIHPPANNHALGLLSTLGQPQLTGQTEEAMSTTVDQIVRLLSGDGQLLSAVLSALRRSGTHHATASNQLATPSTDYTRQMLSHIASNLQSAHALNDVALLGQAAIPSSGIANDRMVNQHPPTGANTVNPFPSVPPATEAQLLQFLSSSYGQTAPHPALSMMSSSQPNLSAETSNRGISQENAHPQGDPTLDTVSSSGGGVSSSAQPSSSMQQQVPASLPSSSTQNQQSVPNAGSISYNPSRSMQSQGGARNEYQHQDSRSTNRGTIEALLQPLVSSVHGQPTSSFINTNAAPQNILSALTASPGAQLNFLNLPATSHLPTQSSVDIGGIFSQIANNTQQTPQVAVASSQQIPAMLSSSSSARNQQDAVTAGRNFNTGTNGIVAAHAGSDDQLLVRPQGQENHSISTNNPAALILPGGLTNLRQQLGLGLLSSQIANLQQVTASSSSTSSSIPASVPMLPSPGANSMPYHHQQQEAASNNASISAAASGQATAAGYASAASNRSSANSVGNRETNTQLLYQDEDEANLTPYQCLLRQQIEVFEQPANLYNHGETSQGRSRKVFPGQVGIRCRHCGAIPDSNFLQGPKRGKYAVLFPSTLEGVYQIGQNMANTHLLNRCRMIPDKLRAELNQKRKNKAKGQQTCKSAYGGGRKYWARSLEQMGVIEVLAEQRLRFRQSKVAQTRPLELPPHARPPARQGEDPQDQDQNEEKSAQEDVGGNQQVRPAFDLL